MTDIDSAAARALCIVDGCGRPQRYKQRCVMHERRLYRYGSDDDPRETLEARFLRMALRTSSCWLWQGWIDKTTGYAQFSIRSRNRLAHRWAYQHWVGEIPPGLQLDHLCRVRHCVRPDHLEPVTPRLNVLRGVSHVAENAVKTHCVNGHEFTEENTQVFVREGRQRRRCRACCRDKARVRRARGEKETM